MKKDLDLVKICSYLFFDGHLYKDLKCFYLSSKNINDLKDFEKIIEKKFKLKGRFYFDDGGAGKDKTHKYRIFNKMICEELEKIGVPKGSKTITNYKIPSWILKNKKFAKEFLRVAYLCEGSMKENDRRNPRISISMHKADFLLKNGLRFMKDLKLILKDNGIETTDIGIYDGKRRKDNVNVKHLRFRIVTKDNNKFIKEIGWFK